MNFDIVQTLQLLPGLLLGLTVHEWAHAYTAYRCGDATAKDRINFNPLTHIDSLGFLFIIFVGFGWAKPVQIDERNFRNPKWDGVKVAFAGPASNVVVAIAFSALVGLMAHFLYPILQDNKIFINLLQICIVAVFINWALFVFNMLPIPPLDGSHIFLGKLKKYPELYAKIYAYGTIGLLGILLLQSQTNISILPIGPIIRFLGETSLSVFFAK